MSFRIKPLLNGFVIIVLSLIMLLVATVIYRLQEIRTQNSYLQDTVIPLVASLAEARFQTVQIQQFMTDASVTGENDGVVDAGKAKDAALAALMRAAELMPELKPQTAGLQASLQQLHDMGIQMAKAYKEGQAAGNEIMKKKGGFDELAEQTHEQVDALDKKVLAAQADSITRLNQAITFTSWLVLVLSVLIILVMLGAARLLYRSVFSQLGGEPVQANAMTATLAKGDLSQHFSGKSPAGSLIALLAQMQLCWIDVVGQIILKGKQLFVISRQVSSGAKQLASNSKTQSDASEAITVNIEELSVAIDNMAAATERIEESGRSTSSGEQMIGRVVKQIHESASSVKHSAGEITTLNSKAAQISSIIQVIREIADQTNLLALNAAIEAARAGESGRGFAVVADEVRKLAERTSASTQSISTLIDEIGVATHQVVSTIEDGVQKVELSVDYAHEALQSMNAIRDDAEQVRSELRHIHTALEETRSNAHDIARKVEQVALMAHDNFDAASALANNTTDLDDLANKLEHTMGFFRMPA